MHRLAVVAQCLLREPFQVSDFIFLPQFRACKSGGRRGNNNFPKKSYIGTTLAGLATGFKSNNRRRKPSRSAIPRTPVRLLSAAIAEIVPCSIAR
jgi:hypothetical protein